MIGALLAAAIALTGVTGERLRARAFFDANNVLVSDPLVLTVDFLGKADFSSIHPPALSRHVDRKVWRLDDESAKTDTFSDARRLTYRVRPLAVGVHWFPSLEFSYVGPDGETRIVRANAIPVHVRPGRAVDINGFSDVEAASKLPQPPDLVTELAEKVSEEMEFDWRKACALPSAEAFRAFDFPEARLNEARCDILDGKWAEALKIYSLIEWRLGQTPEIERGIVAALAVKDGDPRAELPVWRQIGRPVLKYAWFGRVAIAVGTLCAVALLLWLVGRGIRALACFALLLGLPLASSAQGLFEQMEQQMNRMRQQMQQMSGGFHFSFGGDEDREIPKVTATLSADTERPQVGAPFRLIVSLEAPADSSVGQINLAPSSMFGLTVTGQAEKLEPVKSANPTNLILRLAIPVRYDVPLDTDISFKVRGMITGSRKGFGGRSIFQFSNSFSCETRPFRLKIAPLPSAGQPADFSGVVSEGLRISELCDRLTVGTNDVITITWKVTAKGFVPEEFLPPGAAYEWGRSENEQTGETELRYRGYFVADGSRAETPPVKISYYDPRTKKYRSVASGGTPIKFTAE